MSIRKRRRNRYSAEERAGWISRYRESGMTQENFADKHDLSVCTLRQWLHHERYSSEEDSSTSGFQELQLLPVGGIETWGAELELSDGHRLRLSPNMPSEWVVQVLKGLRNV